MKLILLADFCAQYPTLTEAHLALKKKGVPVGYWRLRQWVKMNVTPNLGWRMYMATRGIRA